MTTIYTPQRIARLNEAYATAIARYADKLTRRAHMRMADSSVTADSAPAPLGTLTAAIVQTGKRNARRTLAII